MSQNTTYQGQFRLGDHVIVTPNWDHCYPFQARITGIHWDSRHKRISYTVSKRWPWDRFTGHYRAEQLGLVIDDGLLGGGSLGDDSAPAAQGAR